MKLLHVIPTYLPARRYGGPIFATHALCAALAAQGCEVTVVTTNVDGPGVSDVPLGVPVIMDGVTVKYFASPVLRRLYYSPAMGREIALHCGEFDLVHLHSVFLWPTRAAARCARRHRVPYVLSPRGMLVKDLIARKSRWAKRAWISIVERGNLEHAAAIHITSETERIELQRFGFRLPRIFEVPNGVSLGSTETGAGDLPPEVQRALGGAGPVVLCLGRINWKKGLDRLIAAMAELPEATLLIVGNDEEQHSAQLAAQAEREGVANRVVFSGPVYGPAKYGLLQRATVFALPSYSENFGTVVLEAMSQGCPVVVTPGGGVGADRPGGFWRLGRPGRSCGFRAGPREVGPRY